MSAKDDFHSKWVILQSRAADYYSGYNNITIIGPNRIMKSLRNRIMKRLEKIEP
jgi:actin-related protein